MATKKAAKKAKQGHPAKLYVWMDDDGETIWPVANEDLENIDHGRLVGVYELVDVRVMRVTKELA